LNAERKVYWHENSQRELAEIIPKLGVVIVPTGSTEIHGPHLGVGNDIVSASRVCEAVANMMYPRALVVRALWLGHAPHNMCRHLPGTITLTSETYIRVLYEVADSLWKHGVNRIMFINGHGGNVAPNILACQKIREEIHSLHGVDIQVGALSYWDTIPSAVWEEVLEVGNTQVDQIGHGGEAETSILMAIAPQMVRTEYMKKPDPRPHGFPYDMMSRSFRAWYQDEYNPDGNTDDPRLASATKGKKLLDAAVKGTVAALEEFIKYRPVQDHQYPTNERK
jgi:creatinine amidohydrolase